MYFFNHFKELNKVVNEVDVELLDSIPEYNYAINSDISEKEANNAIRSLKNNQRLSRACIVHLVIKRTNWSYVKTMSCSGSHLGITINIKKHKVYKGSSND